MQQEFKIVDEVSRYCEQSPILKGEEYQFSIGDLELESGQLLKKATVGLVTHGTLNVKRDNALLLLPGTSNSRHSADGYIGVGKAFDPNKHFIISFEAIGSGTSSKPSDGLGEDFPTYNIRDLVRSQFQTVKDHFGLTQFAVAGASMGAFQALEWAIHYPHMVSNAVFIVPAASASNVFRAVTSTCAQILKLSKYEDLNAKNMTGLLALESAVRVYFSWSVTDAYLERVPRHLIDQEIAVVLKRLALWNFWDYHKRYQASASHDVSQPFKGKMDKALQQVNARSLIVTASSDRLLGTESAGLMHRYISNSQLVTIETDRGHLGWRAVRGAKATDAINQAIRHFYQSGESIV